MWIPVLLWVNALMTVFASDAFSPIRGGSVNVDPQYRDCLDSPCRS
jgi:hypothetical protein